MPIHWASRSGDVEMIRFLIEMGSSPTSCMKGKVNRNKFIDTSTLYCILHHCSVIPWPNRLATSLFIWPVPLVRQLLYVSSLRNMGLIQILKTRFDEYTYRA